MSRKSRTAAAAVIAAAFTLVAPVTEALADPPCLGITAGPQDCLRPIMTPPHSADVVQGWIDGCRRAATEPSPRGEGDDRRVVKSEENGRTVLWLRHSQGPSHVWLDTSTGVTVVVRGAG